MLTSISPLRIATPNDINLFECDREATMDFNTASERAQLRKALARPARLEIAGQLLIGTTCVTGIPDVRKPMIPRFLTGSTEILS